MGKDLFYHLRSNKFVDRQLFLQILTGLNTVYNISEYQYIGFGSYMFDDFRMVHNTLNINSMISLECNDILSQRAEYNLPYDCIDIVNETSTNYISEINFDENEHSIFWLDYTSPTELGIQLSDYCTLIEQLNVHDIIRITLNAHPKCLSSWSEESETVSLSATKNNAEIRAQRLATLRKRAEEYLPSDTTENNVTNQNYPKLLLKCLESASTKALPLSEFQNKYLFPLSSTVYDDSTQMMTFTGIILKIEPDDGEMQDEDKIKNKLSNCQAATLNWEDQVNIDIPILTHRELNEINSMLPGASTEEVAEKIKKEFPFIFKNSDKSVNSYLNFYKFYPNFHHINF